MGKLQFINKRILATLNTYGGSNKASYLYIISSLVFFLLLLRVMAVTSIFFRHKNIYIEKSSNKLSNGVEWNKNGKQKNVLLRSKFF